MTDSFGNKQRRSKDDDDEAQDANRDPLTGAAGAHPVGTGLGAAAGGMAAGAAAGTVAGPVGTLLGAAAGAVVGGLAGKAIGEAVDPTREDAYWRANYSKSSYYQAGMTFEDYAPAYRAGYEGRAQHAGREFDDVEGDLEAGYNRAKGASRLSWEKAKLASRAAWDRI